MQKDLFGKTVRKKPTRLERALKKNDSLSFQSRLERYEYIARISPKGYGLLADPETVYIFEEAKMTFINGGVISTILLAQAFIERRLQFYYNSLGLENVSKKDLKAIIDDAKRSRTVNEFLLDRIDLLRRKRNPFVHLKDLDHQHNISQRLAASAKEKKMNVHPIQMIEEDAKEAIALMYQIFIADFSTN